MRIQHLHRMVAVLATVIGVCSCQEPASTPAQALRVHNVGSAPIDRLTIGFVSEGVTFTNLSPGSTTDYLPIRGGVYRYGSYRFPYAGNTVERPVADFVGETPLEGDRFTYHLRLVLLGDGQPWIQLVDVTRDQ